MELGVIECRQLRGRANGEALGLKWHDDAIGAESDIGARHLKPSITARDWISRDDLDDFVAAHQPSRMAHPINTSLLSFIKTPGKRRVRRLDFHFYHSSR